MTSQWARCRLKSPAFRWFALNRLFRRWSKEISKPRVTGLYGGNSLVIGEFPAQNASNAFDDVITQITSHTLKYHYFIVISSRIDTYHPFPDGVQSSMGSVCWIQMILSIYSIWILAGNNWNIRRDGVRKQRDHYNDVTMSEIASQITSLTIVYSILHSDADQRKHQSSASLAFVWGSHRGTVNSPHKWPVTRKMFPFDDVIMCHALTLWWRHQMEICSTLLALCEGNSPLSPVNSPQKGQKRGALMYSLMFSPMGGRITIKFKHTNKIDTLERRLIVHLLE